MHGSSNRWRNSNLGEQWPSLSGSSDSSDGICILRTLKTFILNTLGALGYELIRKPPGSTHKAELSGLTFTQFLQYYLMTRNLSSFFFIQVGANDGISNDCVHDFAVALDLKGLIIEPQAAVFKTLKANYKGCHNLALENAAISDEDGRRALYTIRSDLGFLQYINQAASFDREHTLKLLRTHLTTGAAAPVRDAFRQLKLRYQDCVESELVDAYTFGSLLKKHRICSYDFLQVDTEGFDYEVIKMADIPKYKPNLINYEHLHLRSGDRDECWDYLRQLGYQIFTHDGETAAYQLQSVDFREPPNWGTLHDLRPAGTSSALACRRAMMTPSSFSR